MKSIININSIQDYISNIEILDGNYYYRGEASTKFPEIMASLLESIMFLFLK